MAETDQGRNMPTKRHSYESLCSPADEGGELLSSARAPQKRDRSLASWLWYSFLCAAWMACTLLGLYVLLFYVRTIVYQKLHYWNWTYSGMYHETRWDSNCGMSLLFLSASYIMLLGPLQYSIPYKYNPSFHRWNGRIFVATCVMGASGALYYIGSVGVSFEPKRQGNGMNALYGVAVIVCAVKVYHSIVYQKNVEQHKLWSYRLAGLFVGELFARLYTMSFQLICYNGKVPLWANTILQYIFFIPFLLLADVVYTRSTKQQNVENDSPSKVALLCSIVGLIWFIVVVIAEAIVKFLPFMTVELIS